MRQQIKEKSFWLKFFGSKFFLLLVVLIFLFIVYSLWGEKKEYTVNKDSLAQLETEVGELEQQNLDLAQVIKYLRSSDYTETEARKKLNMQKPGEKVVIVPDINELKKQIEIGSGLENKANWVLWLEYFLGD